LSLWTVSFSIGVAATESVDWGWLAVSSASLEAVVEHFRSLTQVLMPDGKAVFFRFWDGRFFSPILQSEAVSAAQLLPVISRGLINGQAIDIGGRAPVGGRVFPWWTVPRYWRRAELMFRSVMLCSG
jgi:type IV secretory pathway protease TraF